MLLLILIFCFCSNNIDSQSNHNTENCVQFSITTNKTEYLESEPVWLENTLVIPIGCEIDYEPTLFWGSDIEIILINSEGDTLKCHLGNPIFDINKIPRDTNNYSFGLQKHRDTIFYAADLLEAYGSPENFESAGMILWFRLPPDTYRVCTILKFSAGRHYIYSISNTQSFEVKKTTGDEVEARNLLLRIGKAKTSLKTIDFINDIIREFHSKYPNSVYSERINYHEYVAYYAPVSLLPEEEQTKILTEYIKSHPDDPYNYLYISVLSGQLKKDIQKLKDFLISLRKSCANSISRFFIDERLFEIEREQNLH